MEAGSLQNRAALVTGASSGIGAAVARALNAWGANVALAARREGQVSIVAPHRRYGPRKGPLARDARRGGAWSHGDLVEPREEPV